MYEKCARAHTHKQEANSPCDIINFCLLFVEYFSSNRLMRVCVGAMTVAIIYLSVSMSIPLGALSLWLFRCFIFCGWKGDSDTNSATTFTMPPPIPTYRTINSHWIVRVSFDKMKHYDSIFMYYYYHSVEFFFFCLIAVPLVDVFYLCVCDLFALLMLFASLLPLLLVLL